MAASPSSPDDGPDDGPRDEEQGTASDADVDREWQRIVARLTEDGGTPGVPSEDAAAPGTAPPPAAGATPRTPSAGILGSPAGAPSPSDPRAWSTDPEADERETHFEPPDPGPVLGGDPLLTMAWAAVCGAPLLFLLSVTVWRSAPQVLVQVAAVLFLAGLGTLLWRMPHRRDDDAGPGAVV
ncbi:hypothetical protein N866_06215 [Actinotalea ferrariae CF5-4]|uniref:DUF308 domain-containing protein n=1 Tax=Actinotalea ferrariae CF5-4 TaxID=948458 RepID=A0A021W087_9CELL|nr:hypothetical protein [Actinotalea ferrariae]EYR64752.1 hypothetical protein N866_06215 [Actinotalea ferrariae CF5-4]